jgi:molybdate transport system substrate-binding protein
MGFLLFLTFPLTTACATSEETQKHSLTIAAAASLSNAFSEVVDSFTTKTDTEITLSFGSTGTLSEQLENGAPFDLFASADPSYIDDLVKTGHIDKNSRSLFACGEIVVAVHPSNNFLIQSVNELELPTVDRIAIANPDIAPYGDAARQVLQSMNIWNVVKDKIVYGENVRQVYQYVDTGDVNFAILPLSLLRFSNLITTTIDPATYQPIKHVIGINSQTTQMDQAKNFIEFLFTPMGKNILSNHHLSIEACER